MSSSPNDRHKVPESNNSNGSSERFRHFAHHAATAMGSPWAFIIAVLVVVVWAITGPIFKFSNTWQLIINTGTTIVTFLMVFLIQNTQNRDTRAIHLKLDELIRGVKGARNTMMDLEELSDEELDHLHKEFQRIREGTSDEHERTGKYSKASENLSRMTDRLSDEKESRDRSDQ